MRKSASRWRKQWLPALLVPVMAFGGFMGTQVLRAEEEIPVLTKEAFIDEVLTDNTTVLSLERQLDDLQEQKSQLAIQNEQLQNMFENVDEYNKLLNQYNLEKDIYTHRRYLELSYKSYLNSLGMGPALSADELTELSNTTLILTTNGEISTIMAISDYIKYRELNYGYKMLGFGDEPVSDLAEFNYFVYPTKIASKNLDAGIKSLYAGIESAKKGISTGSSMLYDTLLMMSETLNILEKNYNLLEKAYYDGDTLRNNGFVSNVELEALENDYLIAKFTLENFERNIDNLKMNVNQMRGAEIDQNFETKGSKVLIIQLMDIDVYVESVIKNDSDIISAKEKLNNQEEAFKLVEYYFPSSTEKYQQELSLLQSYRNDYELIKIEKEIEIRNDYFKVIEARNSYMVARQDFETMNNTLEEVTVNYELGFITYDTINEVSLGVYQAANNLSESGRQYYDSLETLYIGSGLEIPYKE